MSGEHRRMPMPVPLGLAGILSGTPQPPTPGSLPTRPPTQAQVAPPPPARRVYFVDRMPETIRIATKRANTAGRISKSTPPDQMMDYWRTHSAWAMTSDDFSQAQWVRYVVDADELRKWDQSKQFRTDSPTWLGTAISLGNQGFRDLARKLAGPNPPGFLVAPNTHSFPHPVIPAEPAPINKLAEDPDRAADKEWMKKLFEWTVHWEGDGSLELDPVGPLDLYIGRFGWSCFPCGTVERTVQHAPPQSDPANPAGKPTTVITLRVTKVGIFAIDKYDFTNDSWTWDQPLGEWNVDAGSEGIRSGGKVGSVLTGALGGDLELTTTGLYYPNMGWRTVTNKVFEAYRKGTNLGRDFVILSNVKYVDFKRTFVSTDGGNFWTQQSD